MSDGDALFALSGRRRPASAAVERTVELPCRIELPTRYYGRLALADTAQAFGELLTTKLEAGDGVLIVTFSAIDPDAGPAATVIDEFLNHALHASSLEAAR